MIFFFKSFLILTLSYYSSASLLKNATTKLLLESYPPQTCNLLPVTVVVYLMRWPCLPSESWLIAISYSLPKMVNVWLEMF